MPWLINAEQLDKFRKNQKNLIILDATWHLPEENAHPKEEFSKHHIIGARFFDIGAFSDPNISLPHMLLHDEALISEKLSALGIQNDCKIIFYDNSKLHTSCRALWMMKVFGHNPNQLYILDGGLDAWEKYGGKIETGEPHASAKTYTAHFQPQWIRTLAQMKTNLQQPQEQVIDMRHAVRYAGGVEARLGVRPGHIPGSFSFPYITMFDNNNHFKPIEKIRNQLTGIGVDLNAPIVTSCGSGITSSILNFVLDLLNHPQHALYDGSWSVWGAQQLYPGESSLAERPVATCIEK